MTQPVAIPESVLVAANRGAVQGTVARWLIHGLRNPLQSLALVAALAEFAGDMPLDATARPLLGDSVRGAADVLSLMDEAFRRAPFDRAPEPVILSDLFTLVRRIAGCRRAPFITQFEMDSAAAAPAVVATAEGLTHVLLNLLLNAHDALGDRGDGLITVRATAADGGAMLLVEDNGPGLAAAVRDRVFEPFVTTKQGDPTAGLGLPVARWLAAPWGAGVELADNPGGGTCAVIRLRRWGA